MNATNLIKLDFTPPETTESSSDFFIKGRDSLLNGTRVFVFTPGVGKALAVNGIAPEALTHQTYALLEYKEPLDYLQVAHIGETKVWIIDDGLAITWLLPDEY